jgi:hypothetical protein
MTFWQALKDSYRGSLAFLIACPLLAMVPVAFEILQHVVEVRLGMYDSVEAAQALDGNSVRLAFGFLKTIALTVPYYWVTRWLATRDSRYAARFEPAALRPFSGFLLVMVALVAIQLFALPRTGTATAIAFFAGEIIVVLLAAWGIASALGNSRIGPAKSAVIMTPQLLWTFALFVLGMLPLMVPHYAFAALAILGPKSLVWPVLIVDSLLVGWLTALLVAIAYFAVKRATDAAGVQLAGTGAATAPAGS